MNWLIDTFGLGFVAFIIIVVVCSLVLTFTSIANIIFMAVTLLIVVLGSFGLGLVVRGVVAVIGVLKR